MKEIKDGYFVIYHGQEYQTGFWEKIPGIVRLSSWDEKSLDNGFYCVKSQDYIEKFGFRCQKEVPKSEITEAYEIRTHAKYKGETLDIIGGRPGFVTLSTQRRISHNANREDEEYRNELIKKGFQRGMTEIDGSHWEVIIPIDDPEVEFIEERTEIDISKL